MTMRKALVAGNWKMNGTRESVEALATGLVERTGAAKCEIAVFPPFVYLPMIESVLAGSAIGYGAQNVSNQLQGAYTGEVSALMLAEFGCKYVLVGHSERRAYYAETDAEVAEKFETCYRTGLRPVLCVGETLQEREAGLTRSVVERQLTAVLQKCQVQSFDSAVIAYEPVWAIGTGVSASPAQAEEVHGFIRSQMDAADGALGRKIRILYGGSVTAENAASLFEQENIDGALVGGASLDASGFAKICQLAGQ
jgi:triosephosphate isomerase